MLTLYIRTSVAATCPMLGLSPLDDGRHRHHRFLLLHHLARLLARSTFTRHRGTIYLVGFLSFTHAHPPEARHHPAFFFLSFFLIFRLSSNGSLVPSSPRHLAKVLPSTLSFLPSLELNSFFWYRFGMVAHCTSLVRS